MDEEIRIDGTANVWGTDLRRGVPTHGPNDRMARATSRNRFRITSSMFDADGKCTEPFALNLTAPNGIGSLVLTFSSTNSRLHGRSHGDSRFPIRSTSAPPRGAPPMRFSRASGFRWATSSAARPQTVRRGTDSVLNANPGSKATYTFTYTLTDAKGLDLGGLRRGQQRHGKAPSPGGGRPHPAARDFRR